LQYLGSPDLHGQQKAFKVLKESEKPMNLKRIAGGAAIAAAVAISPLTIGAALVSAAPLDPPPSPTQPAPGGPGMSMAPTTGAVPHSGGGGPHSGGGSMTQTTKTP
jgi:hypothetical protein